MKVTEKNKENKWHFEQKMRGGRVHKDKSKLIPRKQKYKNRGEE